MFKKVIILLTMLSAAIAAIAQQQQVSFGLPDPAPAWPADGVIPAELKTKYVFIDASKNEFVIAYPENLGKPEFEKEPGTLRIARYELLREVAPSVAVSISPAGSTYKYTYAVANGKTAKQSIDQFTIVAPEPVADSINRPDGWFSVIQKGRAFKVQNPDWIKTGGAAVWSFQKPEAVIPPGSKKEGFELESSLRPGFTIGFFRKAESVEVKVATSGNIPDPVKEQKDELLALEYNSKTVLMLGPKFAADVDAKTIAADFIQGINLLGRTGALNADSAFVKNTLAELNNLVSSGAAPRITAQPGNEVEASVLSAVKVSLKVN